MTSRDDVKIRVGEFRAAHHGALLHIDDVRQRRATFAQVLQYRADAAFESQVSAQWRRKSTWIRIADEIAFPTFRLACLSGKATGQLCQRDSDVVLVRRLGAIEALPCLQSQLLCCRHGVAPE
jgi:hypothetical protein